MITQEQAQDIRARVEAYDKWAFQFRGKNGWTVIPAAQAKLAPVQVTNEERGALEAYEFQTNPPLRYFAYVKQEPITSPGGYVYRLGGKVTTWAGDKLGDIIFSGREYRSTFGDSRINIRVRAINGAIYSGTYYKSSGDYCRLRKVKG